MNFCGLGVNIDHVATLRQVRQVAMPSPLEAALLAEQSGADGITLHLREDRRHIQDDDVHLFKNALATRMNLEIAVTDEMLAIAAQVKPFACCFVPEKRAELTTEGGLDVVAQQASVLKACRMLTDHGVRVALFIDPDISQVDAAVAANAAVVELHTGHYVNASNSEAREQERSRLAEVAEYAYAQGLIVHAGHGLDYQNVAAIAEISEISELNIGHSIVARAVMVGMANAVQEMKELMSRTA